METVVAGRHTEISDKFRDYAETKLSRLEKYASRILRVDVEVTHERNPRQSDVSERVEITVHGKGPVVRAEAVAGDRYAAFEVAYDRVSERLRRAADKRKTKVKMARKSTTPVDAGIWEPPIEELDTQTGEPAQVPGGVVERSIADSPVIIREKEHAADPMTVEDAVTEMELVGHPFFLFMDSQTHKPSVLYRRRGWTYGVIRLADPE